MSIFSMFTTPLVVVDPQPAASGTGIRLAETVGDTKEFEIQGPAQHNKLVGVLATPGLAKTGGQRTMPARGARQVGAIDVRGARHWIGPQRDTGVLC